MLDDFEKGYTLAVHRCPHYHIAKPPLSVVRSKVKGSIQSARC